LPGAGGRHFGQKLNRLLGAVRFSEHQSFCSRYSTGAAAKKSVTSSRTRVRRIAGKLCQMRRP